MCYEWASSQQKAAEVDDVIPQSQLNLTKTFAEHIAAPIQQIDRLLSWWESRLWDGGFFGGSRGYLAGEEGAKRDEEQRAAAVMTKLRSLFMRARPSESELGV